MSKKLKKLLRHPGDFVRDSLAKRIGGAVVQARIAGLLARRVSSRHRYSVVSAAYNVEGYLDEYFTSLVNQSLDFREHIEVVIVDDGSTDGTAVEIEKWVRRFPDNIRYIHKENGGASSARNRGIEAATGEWVTFIDPDDFVKYDYFAVVDAFLEQHAEASLCLVSCPTTMYLEDTKSLRNTHPLAWRFRNGDVVRPVSEMGPFIQLSAAAAFFRGELLKAGAFQFDERIRPNFEDGHLVGRFLMAAKGYSVGFAHRATYFYRRRADESSQMDRSWLTPRRYTDVLEYGYLDLLRRAREDQDAPPRWMQRTILYDLMWHFKRLEDKEELVAFLTPAEKCKYRAVLSEIFSFIEPEVLSSFELASVRRFHKAGISKMLQRGEYVNHAIDAREFDASKKLLRLAYFFTGQVPTEEFRVGGVAVKPVHEKVRVHTFLGETFYSERIVELPVPNPYSVVVVEIDGVPVPCYFGKSEELGTVPVAAVVGGAMWLPSRLGPVSLSGHMLRRAATSEAAQRFAHAWLFMDRDTNGDDNAEHLYRWVRGNRPEVNAYFVLREGAPDWERLRREGFRLLAYGTREHKLAYLAADHLVSSHADYYIENMLPRGEFGDLLHFKYSFLQHGVIKDDLSAWLNRRNMKLFVTTTPAEYQSIAGNDNRYKFTSKEIVLTGLPRHDALLERAKNSTRDPKTIVVMPTWREGLVGKAAGSGNTREYSPEFAGTAYVKHWKAFLNDPMLKSLATEGGYKVVFFPHMNVAQYVDVFEVPEYIEVKRHDLAASIQDVFLETGVLVTDYSSVAFDIAFLGRPIVYFQFDRDFVFGGGHITKKGYFDYETDGFGPVCLEQGEVVQALTAIVRGGFVPAEEYRLRTDATFPFRDGKCCERVFNAIAELDRPAF